MFRPVVSLPFPNLALTRFQEYGFIYCEDLLCNQGTVNEANRLLKPWDINVSEKLKVQAEALKISTALDVLQEECALCPIVTFTKVVDDILNGGLSCQEITEFCGAPGSGKTQLCIQLCINVQIPKYLGGLGSESCFINTTSGFSVNRLREMSEACVNYCNCLLHGGGTKRLKKELKDFTVNTVMKGVHYISVHDIPQFMAALQLVDKLLCQNNKVKLVVVDSITFPLLHSGTTSLNKTRLLNIVFDKLENLISKYGIAVVVTNHLTTRILSSSESKLIPSSGESFGHRVNCRIMLGHVSKYERAATLFKSSSVQSGSAVFRIVRDGIRDCPSMFL